MSTTAEQRSNTHHAKLTVDAGLRRTRIDEQRPLRHFEQLGVALPDVEERDPEPCRLRHFTAGDNAHHPALRRDAMAMTTSAAAGATGKSGDQHRDAPPMITSTRTDAGRDLRSGQSSHEPAHSAIHAAAQPASPATRCSRR